MGMTTADSLQSLLLVTTPIPNVTLDSISQALHQFEKAKHWPSNLDNLYRDLGWKYIDNKAYASGYIAMEQSLRIAQKTKDTIQEAYSVLAIGQLYMALKDHNKAATHLKVGLGLALRLKDEELIKYAYNCNIELEFDNKNYQLAASHVNEAIEYFKNHPPDRSFHFYNVLGLIDLHFQRWNDAEKRFKQALEAASVRPEIDKGFIYGNLGSAYVGLQLFDSAWYYFNQDLYWSLKRNYYSSAFSAAIGLMEAYLLQKEQSIQTATYLASLTDSLATLGEITISPNDYATIIKVLKDIPLADRSNRLEKILKQNSFMSKQKSEAMKRELQNIQKLADTIRELNEASNQAYVVKSINNVLFASGAVILLVAAITTWIYSKKTKQIQLSKQTLIATIQEKEAGLAENRQLLELRKLEIDSLQQQIQHLQQTLNFQQSKIEQSQMTHEYLLSAKQKTIDRLVEIIDGGTTLSETLKHGINLTLNELKQLEKAAHHLAPETTQNNLSFEEQVFNKYPDLTSDEIKILTYIRMNMSTAEIARLKSITVAGVNKSRNRIRKKLGLAPTDDLRTHLLQF